MYEVQGVHKVWVYRGFHHLLYHVIFPPHRFVYLNDDGSVQTRTNLVGAVYMYEQDCLIAKFYHAPRLYRYPLLRL